MKVTTENFVYFYFSFRCKKSPLHAKSRPAVFCFKAPILGMLIVSSESLLPYTPPSIDLFVFGKVNLETLSHNIVAWRQKILMWMWCFLNLLFVRVPRLIPSFTEWQFYKWLSFWCVHPHICVFNFSTVHSKSFPPHASLNPHQEIPWLVNSTALHKMNKLLPRKERIFALEINPLGASD